ncbi:MAG: hypothetical protein KKH01_02055 [Firmicutes bacterium]|nr:hypothetical protein [Bacillota bacterium]
MYRGLTYLGSSQFTTSYGLNECIIDQKAIGVQHLYINDFKEDLIHSACTVVTHQEKAYFGDRIKPRIGHAQRVTSSKTYIEDHSVTVDVFSYPKFIKIDRVGAGKNHLTFETEIKNTTKDYQQFQVSSLVISSHGNHACVTSYRQSLIYALVNKYFAVIQQNGFDMRVSLDAPSGFAYHGIEDILYNKNHFEGQINSHLPIAMSINQNVDLKPDEKKTIRWAILVATDETEIRRLVDDYSFEDQLESIKSYWKKWLYNAKKTPHYQEESHTMLVALRGALLNGFLPADLTGHYFANGKACFYVRDALMGARAFLYSGFYDEYKSIIHFLTGCQLKENGEFFQRYNANQMPDEGANNNVSSQIDAIGYFARIIADDYALTKQMIVPYSYYQSMINSLKHISKKNGLFGPEGGVNEGVYGPAYIISTNMFIVGGLYGASYLANELNHADDADTWKNIAENIQSNIEQTFLEEQYYPYGYVSYHNEVIKRYDTPQLLSLSLGYPMTEHYIKNYQTLLNISNYFNYGIGYSEQEYHNGPWIFNTAAAAEVAFLTNDMSNYHHLMLWMIAHRNHYGLLPEAIQATDENIPFINPLMWANAEFITAAYIKEIENLRRKDHDSSKTVKI